MTPGVSVHLLEPGVSHLNSQICDLIYVDKVASYSYNVQLLLTYLEESEKIQQIQDSLEIQPK